jgi:uncharacterized protein YwqG
MTDMALRDFLNRLRHSKQSSGAAEPPDPTPPVVPGPTAHDVQLLPRLRELAEPCARIVLGGDPGPTDSYLAGYPYLPEGATWPHHGDQPMAFLGQVNFAQVPELPGFPRSGLLQWFVPADDTYGLFGDVGDIVPDGQHVRWYSDLTAPTTHTPDSPPPADDEYFPLEITGATAMRFEPGLSLPSWEELPPQVREEPLWAQLAAAHGEPDETELVYEEHARGHGSPLPGVVAGSKVGGHATFTQNDPRDEAPFPDRNSPAGRLLICLDSAETGGWGDAGIGMLFGDPEALARGDVSSITYNWDCG